MFDLKNQVAVVTGGASGIGNAISELFAERSASVHIVDADKDKAEAVAREIRARGHLAAAHHCDISHQVSVIDLFERLCRQGGVDVLVNNAGIAFVGNLENTREADMQRVFDVNVKGAYNCMLGCIPHMKAKRKGVILNLASTAALIGLADRFAYSMSKGALLAMTYSVAKDYLPYNIRCNSISPARVHTPFVDGYIQKNYPGREAEMFAKLSRTQPIGRMGQPREIASLALFLCSNEASFITGTNYPIDGGALTLSI